MKKVFALGLIAFFAFSLTVVTNTYAADQRMEIEVMPKYLKLPANISRAPIHTVRIRSSALRDLIKEHGVTFVEKVYETVQGPEGPTEEAVSGVYVLVFPEGTSMAGLRSQFEGVDVVTKATLK